MRAGLGLDAPDIADKLDETAGLFDLDRFARDAHREHRIEAAGAARGFDQCQTDPRRRRGSNRNICGGSDRYADAGEAENPWIGGLAGQVTRALARGVADIAKDEEIADRRAGKACAVDRLAGPKSLHKSSRRTGDRTRFHLRLLDLTGQRRIDGDAAIGGKLDKALRQIRIARGKRRADFALGDVSAENAIQRPIADLDRVIHGEPRARLHAAANDRKRGACEQDGAQNRKGGMAQHGQ